MAMTEEIPVYASSGNVWEDLGRPDADEIKARATAAQQLEEISTVTPCCNAPVIHYRSFNKKACPDCGKQYDWYLKEGQLPLIKATR